MARPRKPARDQAATAGQPVAAFVVGVKHALDKLQFIVDENVVLRPF